MCICMCVCIYIYIYTVYFIHISLQDTESWDSKLSVINTRTRDISECDK